MEGLTECGFGWVSPCPAIRAGDRKHDAGSSEGTGMHRGAALPTIVAVVPIVVAGGILTIVLVAVEVGRLAVRPPGGFGRGWPGSESRPGSAPGRVGASRAPQAQKTGRST